MKWLHILIWYLHFKRILLIPRSFQLKEDPEDILKHENFQKYYIFRNPSSHSLNSSKLYKKSPFQCYSPTKKNYIYIIFSRILLVWFIHFHLLTLIWTHTCIPLNFSLHNQDATYSKNSPLWLCLNLKLNWPGWKYKSKKSIKLQSRNIFQCHFYYSLKNEAMLSVLHCIRVLMINEDVWQRMLNLFFTLEKRVTYTR